jgi:hypothetical protein
VAERAHHHDVVGHTSADDQYQETPSGAGYEHTDASVYIVVKFIGWLIVAALVIHVGLGLLFNAFATRRVAVEQPRFPLAANEGPRLPPEPRLQQFPRQDIMNFRRGEEAALQHYGWVDKEAGTVRMPIQDAMRLMLERKMLRSRAQPTGESPGLAPADSSAGRTMEKRKQ